MSVDVAEWESRLLKMRSLWQGQQSAAGWEDRLQEMRRVRAGLVADRAWLGGPRTLLAALRLSDLELRLTGGLAWLLRPDGHHRLGDSLLRALMEELGAAVDTTTASVVTEESRDNGATRADVVVYGDDWRLIIEAKVYAREQERQLDRVHELWSDNPRPHFLYLTRTRAAPLTAVDSADAWQQLTWSDVARLGRTVVAQDDVAPGVHDYIVTLEEYHSVRTS